MATKKKAAQKSDWPIEGKTVALAKGYDPPTVNGEVNVGMDHTIHLPSEEAQRAGFTPYKLNDDNQPVDATRELLLQFPGIYKQVVEKGKANDGD